MDNTVQNQISQIPQEMKNYIMGLIEDSGMTNVDEDLRNEMIMEIFQRLDKYITSVMVENMKTEDVETFIKMNEERKSQEEIQNFISEKIPNAKEVLTKAFVDFRELYIGKVTVASTVPQTEEVKSDKSNSNLN